MYVVTKYSLSPIFALHVNDTGNSNDLGTQNEADLQPEDALKQFN